MHRDTLSQYKSHYIMHTLSYVHTYIFLYLIWYQQLFKPCHGSCHLLFYTSSLWMDYSDQLQTYVLSQHNFISHYTRFYLMYITYVFQYFMSNNLVLVAVSAMPPQLFQGLSYSFLTHPCYGFLILWVIQTSYRSYPKPNTSINNSTSCCIPDSNH